MKKVFTVAAILVLTVYNNVAAAEHYIGAGTILPTFISPPALNTSGELAREAAEIEKIQRTATQAQIIAAENEIQYKPELVARNLLDTHPAAAKLLENVNEDCEAVTKQAKDYWHITRPYLADSEIKALITPPGKGSYSYPSGHTACSMLTADVLGQLMPDRLEIFRSQADEIAANRVLGGVHWPQDLAGGKELALLMFGALQMSSQYQNDLAAAGKELK